MAVQEELRHERANKDKIQREKDQTLSEKYSYEQEVAVSTDLSSWFLVWRRFSVDSAVLGYWFSFMEVLSTGIWFLVLLG